MAKMFHEATVLGRRVLSRGMIRLTLGGPSLAQFASTGVGDEYFRLFFPNEQTGRLHLPHIEPDGRWTYPDGQDATRCSTYTVRHFRQDPCQVDVDMVVHSSGRASVWAQNCEIGDVITVNNPRGLYAPPRGTRWQLLVADATGLPAVARLLEQAPSHIHSRVFIELADPAHQLRLPQHPNATVTWLHESGNGVAPSRMADIVSAVPLPQEDGYVWVAGEQKVVRAIRKFVRHELKLPAERYQLVGYWIAHGEDWTARHNALPQDVRAAIEAGWNSERDHEEVRDEYEAVLEKFGL